MSEFQESTETTAETTGVATTETAAAATEATTTEKTEETGAETGDETTTALGGKAEETKADAAPAAPEKYELTAPDGMTFDTEAFEAVEPALREANLTNEAAQGLMNAYAEKVLPVLQQRTDAAIAERANASRKAWNDAFEADPEIGGAKKDETLTFAAKAFDHYGLKKGEGLRALLDESGLGNHPDMIRFVSKIGRDLGEAGFERGESATAPLTASEKFYGKDYGKPQAEQRS